jgi:inorganic triphosphatase YgiF
VSVYFDTDQRNLQKSGLILRVRRIRKRYIQTIKAARNSDPIERDEWENEIAAGTPDLTYASGTLLEPIVSKKFQKKLAPVFETRILRTLYPFADESCEVALTIDRGTVETATHSMPICEIELELKRGSMAKVFELAREIAKSIPARVSLETKSEQGYHFVDGKMDAALKADSIRLPARATAIAAFRAIGVSCLRQILGNEAAVIKRDPDGVHQMRVGLRRLRSAMSLFGELLTDAESKAIKGELKWASGQLTPARELDVLHERVLDPTKRRRRHLDGFPSLSPELVEKRAAALTHARDMIESERFRAIGLNVLAWLEVGQWSSPSDDLRCVRGRLPIEMFASEELDRRWHKIIKKRKKLDRLDAKPRHRLRIQAKKVRYASEFFGELFTEKQQVKRRKKMLATLERLQDALGDLNDIAVHQEIMSAMGLNRRASSKRAFAAGLLSGLENARVGSAMKAGKKAFDRLAKIDPYWR